ncbi:AP endonuclease 1 [Fusarium subglutinans]|uniref:Apurinic-apyrimidinic endonuclease 1 n=1 Tax=Gibberella subglutinans TaxID=42677 RepID=A0A8H5PU99_GIBSU|nr:AP endonuclease 1 [Fusarium subglutinans]KAF5603341.1 AP endonuclease 1 [Fusarium subglutinans]
MARTSLRKKQAVSYNEDPGDEMPQVTKAVAAATKVIQKTKGAVTKTATAKAASVKTVTKRKASPEPEIASRALTAKTTKKRKTKAKDEDAIPLADRTDASSLKPAMNIGAHAKRFPPGVQNSVTNAVHIGANAFALFLKSQRKWTNPPLDHEAKNQFISMCKEHSYSAGEHALPHGSYLVNLAQADEEKADQAYKSFLDDLERCEQLGIRLYNFHPGSTGGDARPAAIARIAAQLNKSHRATKTVITVLENMAGSGNVIGSTWEDLRDIIALVEDKSRVGVCIDTCHAFAAGYDLRTPEAFMNDSKAPFNSNRDLHANIGTGFLGLRAFHCIMNHAPFAGMPMVLETPIDRLGADGKSVEDKKVWANEIKLLERLVGMDAETEEFKGLEKELQAQGESERNKIQDQVDRKMAKDAKKGTKKGGKRKKKDDSDDESE